MRLLRFAVVCYLAAALPAAAHEGSPRGSTVSLEATQATPSALAFLLRSPYARRPFVLEALGPSGGVMRIASGTTDERGQGTVTIQVRDDELLANQNGVFLATVDAGDDALVASARIGLRVGRAPGGSSIGTAFVGSEGLLPAGGDLTMALVADLDGDGDEDLVAAGAREGTGFLDLHANDGTGTLSQAPAPILDGEAPANPRALASADIDGDGDLDLFVGTGEEDATNLLLVNDGAGILSRKEGFPSKGPEGTRTNAALFADVDGDGDADLFVTNGITGSHGVPATLEENQLLLNDGLGSFAPSASYLERAWPAAVSRGAAAGDVDLDGDLDILVAMAGPDILLVNDGTGVFEDGSSRLPASEDSTYAAAFADVDADGDLDILLANAAFSPAVQTLLINAGGVQGGNPGTFEQGEFPALAAGQSPVRLGLQVADVDADGDPDLIFAVHELGAGERPDLYVNQGGSQGGTPGAFLLDPSFPLASGVYPAVPVADMDGDGDLDVLAVPSATPADRRIFTNLLFDAPDAPLGFQRGDFNGDLTLNISDPIALLAYLFSGGEAPPCILAGDANDDDALDLSDAVAVLNHLFSSGEAPVAPFPAFGDDPTPGGLECGWFTGFQDVQVSR